MTEPERPAERRDDDLSPLLVRLPTDLDRLLRDRAEAEDRSMAGIIRIALRRYLKELP